MNAHTKIKMMRYDHILRRYVEVTEKYNLTDDAPVARLLPLFEGSDGKFYSVPDYPLAIAWREWVNQQAAS